MLSLDLTEKSREFMRTANRLPTLFDLEDAAYELLALLDSGEIEPAEAEAQLALLDQMMIEKSESYVSVIRSLEAMATARKVEADRLRDRARSAEKSAEWLKNRLLVHMQTSGRQRIETARFTVALRQNPVSVHVLDASLIPAEFQRTKIEVTPDLVAIKAHAKSTGEVVPGTELVHGQSLRIA